MFPLRAVLRALGLGVRLGRRSCRQRPGDEVCETPLRLRSALSEPATWLTTSISMPSSSKARTTAISAHGAADALMYEASRPVMHAGVRVGRVEGLAEGVPQGAGAHGRAASGVNPR